VQPGGGDQLVQLQNELGNLSTDKVDWAHTIEAPHGVQPQIGGRPPKKPDVRCDTNPVPDLNAGLGQVGPPSLTPASP
jgi:hypothetical protein